MNGLINSDGNYAVIINTDKQRVDVTVYNDKTTFEAGIDPFFEKTVNGNFQCGEALSEAYNDTTASGVGGKSVATNVILVAETVIETLATEDPNRFRIPFHSPGAEPIYIKGDWAVWTA